MLHVQVLVIGLIHWNIGRRVKSSSFCLKSVSTDGGLPTFRSTVLSTHTLRHLTLNMKAVESFETSGYVQPQSWRHTPDTLSLKQYRCENLKFPSALSVTPGGLSSMWTGSASEVSDVTDTECVISCREQIAHNQENKCDINNTWSNDFWWLYKDNHLVAYDAV